MDRKRQIGQLWLVAEMYYGLAVSEKNTLDPSQLQMTVQQFAEKCKDPAYLENNRPLLNAIAFTC